MKKIFFLLALFTGFVSASAQNDKSAERLAQYNLSDKTLAIEGYDPVSYFTGSPKKGSSQYTVQHEGVVYRFANAINKQTFLKSPSAYEPQYGGWCAYAMGAKGEKVEVDPETYKIVNGKLYLFYNSFFNNTLKSWNKDEAALKAKADASWMKFYK
jgi:YHS domain-containing protein